MDIRINTILKPLDTLYFSFFTANRNYVQYLLYLTFEKQTNPFLANRFRDDDTWFCSPYNVSDGIERYRSAIREVYEGAEPYAKCSLFMLDVLERCLSDSADRNIASDSCTLVRNIAPEDLKEAVKQAFFIQFQASEHFTPNTICSLAKEILNPKESDSIGDLCCGVGNFLSQFAGHDVFGAEVGLEASYIAYAITRLCGAHGEIVNEDALLYEGKKFNKVFCDPPMGVTLPRSLDSYRCDRWSPLPIYELKRSMSAWLFVGKALERLKEGGIAIVRVPDGALFSNYEVGIRKAAVERGLVSAVIALPTKCTAYSNVATSLLVLSRGGNHAVRFINARNMGRLNRSRCTELSETDIARINALLQTTERDNDAISVAVQEIVDRGSSLLPLRYLQKPKPKPILKLGIALGEIIDSVLHGATIPSYWLTDKAETDIRVVSGSDILDGRIDVDSLLYLTKEGKEGISERGLDSLLSDGDVILTNKSTIVKSAAISPKGQKVLLSGSLIGLRLNKTKANPEFVPAFLNSNIGQELLFDVQTGTKVKIITVTNLLSLPIPVLSLDEQSRYVLKAKEIRSSIIKEELRISELKREEQHLFDHLASYDEVETN